MIELNKIYNEDCLTGLKRIPDNTIDIICTDPPYNVGKNYGKDLAGQKFNDKKSNTKYWRWLYIRLNECYRVLKDGGAIYISHTDHGIFNLKKLMEKIGFNFIQILIWYGRNGYSGLARSRWVYRFEPILYLCKGSEIPKLEQGLGLEWYTNVIEVPRPQSNFKTGRFHVCQKPVKLYRIIVGRHSGKLVLDPFIGSGTTAIAAIQKNKSYIGFELLKKNVEISNKRLAGWLNQKRLIN